MHRIDTSTAQIDKFGQGKNGFTNGDPATGRRATDLNSDMWDAVQEEICGVIEKSGLVLKKEQHDQLYQAIVNIITSRIPDALLRNNNLSDVVNKAVALSNLGGVPATRKVNNKALSQDITIAAGDVGAVQQGGGTGMATNKIYLGWDGAKLVAQVDATPLGKVFCEHSPPTAAQCGAFPADGGVVGNKGLMSPFMMVKGHGALNQQGTWIGWNESNGQGESNFINNRGSGTGGFKFRIVNADNSKQSGEMSISGDGSLNASGTVSERGQRVYSPNNSPPVTSMAVTNVRRGSQIWLAAIGGGGGLEVPAGHFVTGGRNNGTSNTAGLGFCYRPLQICINNNWFTIGDI